MCEITLAHAREILASLPDGLPVRSIFKSHADDQSKQLAKIKQQRGKDRKRSQGARDRKRSAGFCSGRSERFGDSRCGVKKLREKLEIELPKEVGEVGA